MIKKYIKFTGLLTISTLFWANSFGQFQREGILNFVTLHPVDVSAIKEYPLRKKSENKIWFLDSCIIWEQRVNYTTEEPAGDTARIEKYSYPVGRYTYFDLRTKHCQDYLSLKDTATPFCNYSLKDSDYSPFYGFFFPKNDNYPFASLDVITNITDTTINNTVFKRVVRLRKNPVEVYRGTFYFNCKMPKTIFKFGLFAKNIEAKYPECLMVKSEVANDSSGIKLGGAEYEIIRNKLTKEEMSIFKCWEQNSKKTTLPLLPHSEVMKLIYPSPEHENPTITIIPREK